DRPLPDVVPGAAALSALLGPAARAAGVRRPGDPARVALPDGEHHRAGRRDQLVSLVTAPAPDGGGAGGRPGLKNWCLALIFQEGEERASRAGAVRDGVLLASGHLGHRARLAIGDERRVVAEAARAARGVDERPGQLAA